jgi:hypothetical protein
MNLGVPTPTPMDPKAAKDFLLFYKTARKGRLEKSVTDSSAVTFWKCFMTAWQRETGDHFPKPLRDTVLNVRGDKPPSLEHSILIDPVVDQRRRG